MPARCRGCERSPRSVTRAGARWMANKQSCSECLRSGRRAPAAGKPGAAAEAAALPHTFVTVRTGMGGGSTDFPFPTDAVEPGQAAKIFRRVRLVDSLAARYRALPPCQSRGVAAPLRLRDPLCTLFAAEEPEFPPEGMARLGHGQRRAIRWLRVCSTSCACHCTDATPTDTVLTQQVQDHGQQRQRAALTAATSQATRAPRPEPLASLGLVRGATSAVGFGREVAQDRWGGWGGGVGGGGGGASSVGLRGPLGGLGLVQRLPSRDGAARPAPACPAPVTLIGSEG
jgi:hypothetical protein